MVRANFIFYSMVVAELFGGKVWLHFQYDWCVQLAIIQYFCTSICLPISNVGSRCLKREWISGFMVQSKKLPILRQKTTCFFTKIFCFVPTKPSICT